MLHLAAHLQFKQDPRVPWVPPVPHESQTPRGAAPLCCALLGLKISPEVQRNPCFGKPGPPRRDALQGPCSEMQHLRGLCAEFDQEIFFMDAPGGF